MQDITAPAITFCPANKTIACGESTDPSNTGTATATDNCDSNPGIIHTDTTTPGDCANITKIVRHWTATETW